MLLSPPLIITREQIDELFEKAWKSLDQTAAALRNAAARPPDLFHGRAAMYMLARVDLF